MTSPTTAPTAQPVAKKTLSNKISNFFRNIGIIAVIALIVIASLFAYIITNPNSQFSKWFVNNTFAGRYFTLNDNQEEKENENNSTKVAEPDEKVGNQLFGLDTVKDNSEGQTSVQLVKNVIGSVISIRTQNSSTASTFEGGISGTGFIVTKDGIVMTNRHVISDACSTTTGVEITAQDQDLKVYQLKLLSIDPIDDIALLQIENAPDNLKPITFSDTANLQLGEEVIAIGNVLGELQNTVTQGIVSGLDRALDTQLTDPCTGSNVAADGLIQTDAAINKGNSGGPLFNSSGNLIGMNTFGATDAQSIGFAIPSNTLLAALTSYRTNKEIIRPRLGVVSQPITPIDAQETKWLPTKNGEIILSPQNNNPIVPNSAAEKVGLKQYDIITEVNDEKLVYSQNNPNPLRKALLQFQPNQEITLLVIRVAEVNGKTPTYKPEPESIKVKLGGISFKEIVKK